MKKENSLLIFLFLFSINCFSQSSNEDSLSIIQQYKNAEEIAEKDDYHLYIKKANEIVFKLKEESYVDEYMETLLGLMNSYSYVDSYKNSKSIAEILEFELSSNKIKIPNKLNYYLRIASCYARIGNYDNSIHVSEIALQIGKKENKSLIQIYNNLGALYRIKGDLNDAINYYTRALSFYNESKNSLSKLSVVHHNLGKIYFRLNNYSKAIYHYSLGLKALKHISDSEGFNRTKAALYNSIGLNYLHTNDIDSSRFYLEKVLKIPNQIKYRYAKAKRSLGKSFVENDLKLSRKYYTEALILFFETFGEKHIEASYTFQVIGDSYNKSKALDYYQKAITSLIHNYHDTLYTSNPTLDLDIISNLNLLKVLQKKANALQLNNESTFALETYELAIDLIYEIRKEIQTAESKIFLTENAAQTFEEAIAISKHLFEETKDFKYLEKAFQISEKNKAILLLEAILDAEAKGLSSIPDSLRNKQQHIKIDIALYDKTIGKIKDDDEKLKRLESERFELNQTLRQLNEDLEKRFPDYFALKYNLKIPTIEEVQNTLIGNDEILLEYFYGEKNIYLFTITNSSSEIFKIPITEQSKNSIDELLASFKDATVINNNPTQFKTRSNKVFEFLFPQKIKELLKEKKSILIIPDGPLGFIPFDALVVDNNDIVSLQPSSYLIYSHLTKQAYSAVLTLQQKQKNKNDQTVLAMAPIFQQNKHGLNHLKFSEQEIADIKAKNITSLLNQDATLRNFYNNASLPSLIHLSTHATTNTDNQQPIIYFADSTLTLPEIYALQINADLVILSACETNLGDVKKGEGIMSLARGFTQAGANSLISSLWSVNENSTALIFKDFYQELAKGKTKSEALHQAKLNYLTNNNLPEYQRNPFTWSGFIFIGKDNPMQLNTAFSPWWIVFAIIGIGLIFFYFKKK